MPKPTKEANPNQRERFIETARQLGANEDENAFKTKLAIIAGQRPKDKPESEDGE